MLRDAAQRMPPPAALGHHLDHAEVRHDHPAAPRLDVFGHDGLEVARAHDLAHVVGREQPVHARGHEGEPPVGRHDRAQDGRLDALRIRLKLKRSQLLTHGRHVTGAPDLDGRPGTHVLLPAGERVQPAPIRGPLRHPRQRIELGIGRDADDALEGVAALVTPGLVAAVDHGAPHAMPMASLE